MESIIHVLDRVQSVVTLPTGLAYCPNRLESMSVLLCYPLIARFSACPFVNQVCVCHEAPYNSLVAIISVARPYTRQWLAREGTYSTEATNPLEHPQVYRALVSSLRIEFTIMCQQASLQEHERPCHFFLTWDEWSHANHFLTIRYTSLLDRPLTASFKIVRRKILDHYRANVLELLNGDVK